MTALPDGTVTMLFTDVEGSTRHVLRLGDAYSTVLARHREIVLDQATRHHGQLVDTQGDVIFTAFSTAHDAVLTAIAAQRALADEPWPGDTPLRTRMGIHTGEPSRNGGGYTGLDVHRAARICSAAHGGQIVMSQTTRSLMSHAIPADVVLVDLGHHRLKDIPQPEHLIQVVTDDLQRDFPPPRTLGAPAGLPLHRVQLIGRTEQVAACEALIMQDGVRLLSLTGPGGTGKTALAVQLAANLMSRFEDGVYFVSLAPLAEASLVPRAIARALGVHEAGPRSLAETLKDALAGRHSLLVLDNFEHVLPAAEFVADLIVACPNLKLLITSREVLRVSHEYDVPVPPLPLPTTAHHSAAQLAENAAIRLFVTRAREVRPSFQLTDETASVIGEICRRLDGLPLALELAAARIRFLPPKALLARLDRRLPILTDGPRDLPARQRTLRDTIGWSYGLLSEQEARLFRRMGVFVGGCTLSALEAVAGSDAAQSAPASVMFSSDAPVDTLDLVASLIDKSLVRQSLDGDEPRFSLLETIREFALDQLDASGELGAARDRHAAYFLNLAETADPFLTSADQVPWLDRLEAELGNLNAALAWLRDTHAARTAESPDAACDQRGLRLAGRLHWFWWLGGHVGEGRRWLRDALAWEIHDDDPAVRARALYAAGTLTMVQGDYQEAHRLLRTGEEIAAGLGDVETAGLCVTYRGIIETYFYESGQHDKDSALQTTHLGIDMLNQTDNLWGQALAISQLGAHRRKSRDFEESERLLKQACAMARAVGERYLIGSCLPKLGTLYLDIGDPAAAEPVYREALAAFREIREDWWTGRCLHYLALAAHGRGDLLRAALLLGCSDEMLEHGGARRNPVEHRRYEMMTADLRLKLGDAAYEDTYTRGRLTSLDAMMALVLEGTPVTAGR